jgi:hypothetical protein
MGQIVDFPEIQLPGDFTPVPTGDYECKVAGVTISQWDSNDWFVRFQIISGTLRGRNISDKWRFTDTGKPYIKAACLAMGILVDRKVKLETETLVGRLVNIKAKLTSYQSSKGEEVPKNDCTYYPHEKQDIDSPNNYMPLDETTDLEPF